MDSRASAAKVRLTGIGVEKSLMFHLRRNLDVEGLRDRFEAVGRVEIADFLDSSTAEKLRRHLIDRQDWVLVMNAGEKVFEIPRAKFAELSPDQAKALDDNVIGAARSGFQFRFETIRVPDSPKERAARATMLDALVEFLSSEPVICLFREITGCPDIDFADGQATAYSAGHFLTPHDDAIEGKNRKAAYVLGLTPDWRAEWGGLLMFHGDGGQIDGIFTPAMGAIRLFSVPVRHSVSYVAPFAPEARLSVTGWLRAAAA